MVCTHGHLPALHWRLWKWDSAAAPPGTMRAADRTGSQSKRGKSSSPEDRVLREPYTTDSPTAPHVCAVGDLSAHKVRVPKAGRTAPERSQILCCCAFPILLLNLSQKAWEEPAIEGSTGADAASARPLWTGSRLRKVPPLLQPSSTQEAMLRFKANAR